MSTPAFRLTRTNHHGLSVRSLPRALSFYHTLLGLPILRAFTSTDLPPSLRTTFDRATAIPDFTARFAYLGLPDGTMLELVQVQAPVADQADHSARLTDLAATHFSFDVVGIQALVKAVQGWEGFKAGEEKGFGEGMGEGVEEAAGLGKGKAQVLGCERIGEGDMEGTMVAFVRGPDGEHLEIFETPGGEGQGGK